MGRKDDRLKGGVLFHARGFTMDAMKPFGDRRRPARGAWRVLWELAAAVAIGVATPFTTKPEQDMHWSIPPTFRVLKLGTEASGQGDPAAE